MRYTKSELRNNRMPLLRRIQRQMDKRAENKLIMLQSESTFDEDFEICNIKSVDKKTRLGLYKKRKER